MKNPYLNRLAGLMGAWALTRYSNTWDSRMWTAEEEYDPKSREVGGPFMYSFWHENILFPVAFYGKCHVATITSMHRDGEVPAHLAEFMGFRIFRGSTTRGGTEALRHLLEVGKLGYHLTMVPDGPKGPRRVMSQGTVFLASRLGFPLIPTGMGYSDCWRANSWDQFAIPKPFARVRLMYGPALCIPNKIRKDELEDYRFEAERRMLEVQLAAEEWAASGNRLPGEKVLNHDPRQVKKYRINQTK